MSPDDDGFPDDFYRSHVSRRRQASRRRFDRRAQIGVVLLAIIAGVVAGMLGTQKDWENPAPPSTTVNRPAVSGQP